MTTQTHDETPVEAVQPNEDIGTPSPVLVVFLVMPLIGILIALGMVATDLREQRAATPDDTFVPVQNAPTLVNYAAPDFTLDNLDGQEVALSDYRGKVVYLNFWQTTCPPCIEEMPDFRDFIEDTNPDEVVLLTVNVDETPADVRDFFARIDLQGIPVVMDTNSEVRRAYGVQGFPVTFIIDTEGVVRFMNIGLLTYDDMEEYLELMQNPDVTG